MDKNKMTDRELFVYLLKKLPCYDPDATNLHLNVGVEGGPSTWYMNIPDGVDCSNWREICCRINALVFTEDGELVDCWAEYD